MTIDNSINSKRLLILGGSYCKEAIKEFAVSNNLTLIAVGNNPNAGICEIANEYYNIDSTDYEAMKRFIQRKNIDGVYMGSSEPVISEAISYVTDLGFPCYCTKRQWEILQNKLEFKNLCANNGLPVVPNYILNEENIYLESKEFPVITKPADGCGSSNFSVCNNNEELKKGYILARDGSASNSVIVEKFVRNEGVVVFYTFSNGEMYFSGLEDKYPVLFEEQGSYVAGMHIFESAYTKEFRARFEDKIKKMFKSIEIKEGTIWMEIFHDGDNYYFNEAGYRYSGSVSIYPVDYFFGINQLAGDITFALTGKSKIFNQKSLIKKTERRKKYCIYTLHLKPGKICKVEGIREIAEMKEIIACPIIKRVGDTVCSTGTVGQTFAYIHFVFDSIREFKAVVDKIHNIVKIIDENGNNLLDRKVDFKAIKISL